MQCQLKIRLKKKVFSLVLKVVNDLQLLISSGREFHNTGAICENALCCEIQRLQLLVESSQALFSTQI